MSPRSTEYQNLVTRGILKAAAKNADSIDQYVKTASDPLADARRPSNSSHGRYLMAYEGLFSLAMAVLEYHGARPAPTVRRFRRLRAPRHRAWFLCLKPRCRR